MSNRQSVTFQEALDIVESLPEFQQDDLVDIVQRRRTERRRALLAECIKGARAEYGSGVVATGSVEDLMKDLTSAFSATLAGV